MLELYSPQGDRGIGAAVPAQPIWIDLLDPTEEERTRVEREFGVRVPSRGELAEIESSSRLRVERERLYLSMPLTVEDERSDWSAPSIVPLGFILSAALLITVRFSDVHAFRKARARFEQGERTADSQAVFAGLAEAMVDFAADALERASGELAAVSRQVFTRTRVPVRRPKWLNWRLRQMLTSVGAAGDKLSHTRESLLGLSRIIGFVSETAREWLHPETQGRLQTVRADLASLTDFEAHLSSKTQFLLDAILGFISIEQNDTFKVLTIVSVVGIPPTLIASMYGMNFHGMPELAWRWGYEYGLGVIALSILVPIAWSKWRGWW
ncbi:MAG: magnesium transporter CorA family protein [Steroidobacteraceae bacterium]